MMTLSPSIRSNFAFSDVSKSSFLPALLLDIFALCDASLFTPPLICIKSANVSFLFSSYMAGFFTFPLSHICFFVNGTCTTSPARNITSPFSSPFLNRSYKSKIATVFPFLLIVIFLIVPFSLTPPLAISASLTFESALKV